MKKFRHLFLLFIAVFLLSACQAGRAVHAVKTKDYTSRPGRVTPEVLFTEPSIPYIIVGIVHIRITRRRMRFYVKHWLVEYGMHLEADAVIPPGADVKRQDLFESIDPFSVFCVFDDGRTSVFQGRAIRYIKPRLPSERASGT